MKVCIIGGGNLAHSYAGELTQNPLVDKVCVVTRKPEKWNKVIEVYRDYKFSHKAEIDQITNDYSVISDADMIIMPLPCHARYECFNKMKEYLSKDSIIILAPGIGGINFVIEDFNPNQKIVTLQRVSYISRLIEYGKSVNTDLKTSIEAYYSKSMSEEDKINVEKVLDLKINEITSIWSILLSNSNPVLHMVRLCGLLDEKEYPHDEVQLLYGKWDDNTSKLALAMDSEIGQIMEKLNNKQYRSLLTHYEVTDYITLTQKLKSLPAFKKLLIPMEEIDNKFYIDKNSRYIVEDLPYGTIVIKFVANLLGIETPTTDAVLKKLEFLLGQKIMQDDNSINIAEWQKITQYNYANYLKYFIKKI